MNPPPTPPDPGLCPLCARPNRCACERERTSGQPQPPCWCTQVSIAPTLRARLPEQARGAACICPACVAQAAAAGRP